MKNFVLTMMASVVFLAGCGGIYRDWRVQGQDLGFTAPMPAPPQFKETTKKSLANMGGYKGPDGNTLPEAYYTITKHQLILHRPNPDAKATPFQSSNGNVEEIRKQTGFASSISPEIVEMSLIVYEFDPKIPDDKIESVVSRRYPQGITKDTKIKDKKGNEWLHRKAVYRLKESGNEIRMERERHLVKDHKAYICRLAGPATPDMTNFFMDNARIVEK